MTSNPSGDSSSNASPDSTADQYIGLLHSWQVFLATGFGVGMLTPVTPGTVGALLGIPLTLFLALIPGVGVIPAAFFQAVVIAVLVLVGIPICSAAQRALGKKDPSEVVWDEITTVPMVFFLVPSHLLLNPLVLLVGFGLHRLIDITKPPPCRQLERLPAGAGIMLDDVAAGAYGFIVMHLWLYSGIGTV